MINLRLPFYEGKSSLIFQFPHQHNSSMGPHEILEKILNNYYTLLGKAVNTTNISKIHLFTLLTQSSLNHGSILFCYLQND